MGIMTTGSRVGHRIVLAHTRYTVLCVESTSRIVHAVVVTACRGGRQEDGGRKMADKDALTAEDLNNLMSWAEEHDEWDMVGLLINEQWSRIGAKQKEVSDE